MYAKFGSVVAVMAASLTGSLVAAQEEKPAPKEFPALGRIVHVEPALDELLAADAKIEKLVQDMRFTEGPVWVKEEGGYLLFSDVPRNTIFKWTARDGATLYMRPSGYTGVKPHAGSSGSNGLAIDSQGRLVLCEHGDRRISRVERDGGKLTLADRYDGKRLNSPNDLAFHSSGDLYFTDPTYGLRERDKDRYRELPFAGVFRLAKDGSLTRVANEMTVPNGLAFSPDMRTLYIAQSDPKAALWRAYEVREDGALGEGRVFFDMTDRIGKEIGSPDGLKVDREGNVWAAGPGGLHVFSPAGKLLGTIDAGGRISNCAWGDDGSVLYLTAGEWVLRVKTKTKGAGW